MLTALLVTLCLGVLLVEVQGQSANANTVAVLGLLVAIAATLRFIEVGIPGPGGFSPIFAPIILGGYVFGARFGFLLGTMAMLTSAIITAGVGPWLPYQMFATGWMGMLSGWLPDMKRIGRWEPVVLAVWGVALGFIFGAIMNIWFWPFLAGGSQPDQSWQPGMPIWQTVRNYAVFYAVTSLWWDMARAVGNAMLILFFAAPILRVLRRFKRRFRFDIAPLVSVLPPETLTSAEN
jgi:energy-coupling factor transport system substrate-specific component